MDPRYSPVRSTSDNNPNTTGDKMTDATLATPETTAGDINSNWNNRDRFEPLTAEDYSKAFKLGFVGTKDDWVMFLAQITQQPSIVDGTNMMEVEDLAGMLPKRPVSSIRDETVGSAAAKAAKMATKYRVNPFVRLVLWLMSFIFIVLTVGTIMAAWIIENYTVSGRVIDNRPCELKQDGLEITGTRSYSYINNELFGFRWSRTSDINERTVVNVSMNGLTVVMQTNGEKSKTMRRGEGEGGIMILPKADYYAFYSNGRATGTTHGELCK